MSRFHFGLCSHPEWVVGGPGRTGCGGREDSKEKPLPRQVRVSAVRSDAPGLGDKDGRELGLGHKAPIWTSPLACSWGYFFFFLRVSDKSSFAGLPAPPTPIIKATYVCRMRLRPYRRELPKSSLLVTDPGGRRGRFLRIQGLSPQDAVPQTVFKPAFFTSHVL